MTKPAHINITLGESNGAVWTVRKTEVTGARSYWVQKARGPVSAAKPHIVGFYAPSIEAAANALGSN